MSSAPLLAARGDGSNTTLGGTNGYIVLPSAEPVYSFREATVTTGYNAIFTAGSFAHIPYFLVGFSKNFEVGLSVDIGRTTDVLLNTKWRFTETKGTSIAMGIIGQAIDITANPKAAGQLYFATTFNSSFIDWPSKTTILVGYTFDAPLNSDIDFGMAFQTPFFKDVLKGNVDFVIDFGNVSYSVSPSGGDAAKRGLLNVGLRLLPVEMFKNVYISADLRALDLFDANGRALSAGLHIALRP